MYYYKRLLRLNLKNTCRENNKLIFIKSIIITFVKYFSTLLQTSLLHTFHYDDVGVSKENTAPDYWLYLFKEEK